MNNGLLILGNGFDLDLGLHTRYSEFWESEGWRNAKVTCPEKYIVTSLEKFRITYDEYSAMEIKDNFRRNGIDVRNLFNKVALDFIMTKDIYDGRDAEIAKLEVLKNEIIEDVEK